MRYYVDGEAIYAGLIYWEGYYYYINSSKKAVRNVTYTTSTPNGLLPIAAYTFDEYGRMMDPPDGSYGRLAGTEDVTISYQYDANGMRTGKTVTRTDKTTGTQTVHAYAYIYNGSQLSQMTVDGHTLRFSYDSGKPMFVKYDGVTYQYILNLQGDVIGIMNHAGTVVVEYVYDAWGNILSVTGSHASTVGRYNPLRYRSYVWDQETGLYYLQSRYYNPEWGRFINADALVSTGQGFTGNNMFAYCGNNPVLFSDPCGTASVVTFGYESRILLPYQDVTTGGGIGSGIATVGLMLLMTDLCEERGKDKAHAVTIATTQQSEQSRYTVYFLCAVDDPGQTIIYVGRVKTENFAARMQYHSTRGRKLVWTIENLDYAQCRAIEQAGMVYFHSINRGSSINNQIRGISPMNNNRYTYMAALWDLINRGEYPGEGIFPSSYWDNLTEETLLNGGI